MRRYLFSLLIVVVGVLLALWVWQTPRRVVRSELHPLFLRYEHNPDVAAGFVKNLRIADTVTIDAVTLQAKDTATWFDIMEYIQVKSINSMRQRVKDGETPIKMFKTPKNNIKSRKDADTKEHDLVICSAVDLSVCIYDVVNDEQDKIIINAAFEKLQNLN